ncbi:MAG: protein kinase domain-containing protein [Gammaproteobacteria bacterium]
MNPNIIPGYRIERRIGKGGMASVYLAIQESLHRAVALKILTNFDSPEFSERFLNEGRIIAQLSHTNIITIHDIGIANGLHYISMEHIEGGDLKQRLKGGLGPAFALDVIERMASALKLAHRRNMVHRDVKPANILFRDETTPILTDFGIAKQVGLEKNVTITGTILGSPHYMSPEQAQGREVDCRSDIYSLGIVFYEMLTGVKPFDDESDIKTIVKHMNEPMPALPEAHARFEEIVGRMTAKRTKDRYADVDELLSHLKDLRNRPTPLSTDTKTIVLAPAVTAGEGVQQNDTPPPGNVHVQSSWGRRAVWSALGIGAAIAILAGFATQRAAAPPALTENPPESTPAGVPVVSVPSTVPAETFSQADALFEEGMAYRNGENTPVDDDKAFDLLKQAAELGHGNAQYYLGLMHGQGRGTAQNHAHAIRWYRQAAMQGVADAQYFLCLSYAIGRGVDPDRVRAYAWCEVAAKHGSQDAHEPLKLLKETVRGESLIAAQHMTDEIMTGIAASAEAKKLTSPDALSARQF